MASENKAITLIELIISIVLIGVIGLTLLNMDYYSRFHVITADRKSALLNETSLVITHMTKQISNAIGDVDNPCIVEYAGGKGIRVNIDSDGDGKSDVWIAYYYDPAAFGSQIRYYPNAGTGAAPAGGSEVLATRVRTEDNTGLVFNVNLDALGRISNNSFTVEVRCRWDPSEPASLENPEVLLQGNIKMPSVSTH